MEICERDSISSSSGHAPNDTATNRPSSRECKLAEVECRDVNCLDLEMGNLPFSVSVLACTGFRQLAL